ncbi:universal stress protein [Verrucomicrobiaceae bacterium N1E253]|uniref:Universal stress protein n=1 Tax=Oceaniferula marina TaxID=2748318 RepID=A0A851GCL1_9BACT|nr:universal stress protein [Oceaniferula marina]NWK54919.1 universal stress protein [Oceaniferula marina]
MKTIVAGIDFSDASKPVLEAATKLARALGEGLHLVHVVEAEPTYAAYGFSPDEFPAMQEVQQESVERAERKLTSIASEIDIKGIETAVLQGQALHSILEYAEEVDADLLVLGSHGHGFLGSLLLGSVAEGCVRKAKFPSLIVPVSSD